MISSAGYTVNDGNPDMGPAIGVALDGVVLLNGDSKDGIDPFYPAVYGRVTNITGELDGVDECLGHPTPGSLYHYHFMPPCVANPNLY